MRLVWYCLLFAVFTPILGERSAFYLEEGNDQTYATPTDSRMKEALEDQILDILDLNEPPISNSRQKRDGKVSNFMSKLYEQIDAEDKTSLPPSEMISGLPAWSSADRIISLSPNEISEVSSSGLFKVVFSLENLLSPSHSTLIIAQLHLFISQHKGVVKVSILSQRNGNLEPFSSTLVVPSQNSAVFNMTTLIEKWILREVEPVVFVRIDSAELLEKQEGVTEAFIVAAFEEALRHSHRRNRRSSSSDSNPSGKTRLPKGRISKRGDPFRERAPVPAGACRKQALYVSFENLGWTNWVIAPVGYAAFHCGGECSFPLHNKMNATNHAVVQTLAHQVHPSRAEAAKCAPVKLGSMKILFTDNQQNVIMKRYRDMVVQECGCR